MKTPAKLVFLCTALFVFLACSKENTDTRPVIAVSVEPQRAILENIAGDRFRIITLMPSGDNPETFEPSPARLMDVENCLIYFTTGQLPFEKRIARSATQPQKFTDVSKGIDLIYGTHTHISQGKSHTHAAADPHIWTSVKNAGIIAENMAAKLAETDPENAGYYQSNLEKFTLRLDSLDNVLAGKTDSLESKAFLIWHPSLSYFARDYGLEQIAVSSETKELSVASVARIIERAREKNVGILFYQKEFDSRQAETVAKSAGTAIVPINPGAYEWENELNHIVDELSRQK